MAGGEGESLLIELYTYSLGWGEEQADSFLWPLAVVFQNNKNQSKQLMS